MAPVKVRTAALLTPVACIARSARVRRAEAAAGCRSDRIYRLIVDRFSKRIRKPRLQSIAEALSQCGLATVIIRISSCIDIRDRCELLIGPNLCRQCGLLDAPHKVAGSIECEIALSG